MQHGTLRDASGSITAGGTAQTVLEPATRRYLLFQNVSDETMWLNFGGTATAGSGSLKVVAGAAFVFEDGFATSQSLSVLGTTTGKEFTCKEA